MSKSYDPQENRYSLSGALDHGNPTFYSAEAPSAETNDRFTLEDISAVLHWFCTDDWDAADGENMVAVVALSDGRFASIAGGCDYTGWDCQASSDVRIGITLDQVISNGLDNEQRGLLGLSLPVRG